MKALIAICFLSCPFFLYSKDYGPSKSLDFEKNFDCHSDRCISYQFIDNRNPPTIKTANAFITSVIYPVELSRCDWGADKVYAITAVFQDGNAQELKPTKKASFPFAKIKITVKPDLGQMGDGEKINLYELPRTNLQCDDIEGKTYDIMLVTNAYPHHQVRLDFESKRPDKSNILKFFDHRMNKANRAVAKPKKIASGSQKRGDFTRVRYIKKHRSKLSHGEMIDFIEEKARDGI
jgi:hypothetical protein